MCFLHSLSLGWLEHHKNKMVECNAPNWEGWLEDATFFPDKPNDSFNLDEFLNNSKADNDLDLVTGLSEFDWLDEKVDFSIFNPSTENDVEYFNNAFNLLLDSVASNSDFLSLSPESIKIGSSEEMDLNLPNIADPNSFGVTDLVLGSPFYEPISEASSHDIMEESALDQVTADDPCLSPSCSTSIYGSSVQHDTVDPCLSPSSTASIYGSPVQGDTVDDYCLSPDGTASYCSTPRSTSVYGSPAAYEYCMSPEGTSSFCSTPRSSGMPEEISASGNFCNTIDEILGVCSSAVEPGDDDVPMPSGAQELSPGPPPVSVEVCVEAEPTTPASDETLSIEEVTASMRKRKFVRKDGKDIPKVQVSLRNVFHPYERTPRRPRDRVERKKVQNKEAAARYRVKKRQEEDELACEVASLESKQGELRKTHDALASEIKYLKSLMREMLQKKGVLK